jgi:hypothetical protein
MYNAKLDLHACMNGLHDAWQELLSSASWSGLDPGYITPFALLFTEWFWNHRSPGINSFDTRSLDSMVRLWVDTIHSAGVDLAAYAEIEVWTIDRILMRVNAKYNLTCRMLHGPKPEDWIIEQNPPGEAYPVYFWRNIEAESIGDELVVKLLDLMHRVEHPEHVHFDVPGGWTSEWDDLDDYTWYLKGWLASMEDSRLAQIEADLERLDAKEFYDAWDLSSVIDGWYHGWYDQEGTVHFESTEGFEDSEDSEGALEK